MTDTIRVAIYARYSTDMQNPNSVRDQLDKCRLYAEHKGWRVVEERFDEAVSGDRDDRGGFQQLRNDIRRRGCDVVLAESLDRLSRDQEHMAALYKEANHYEVELHTVERGGVDAMQIGFSSTLSAVFLEDLKNKTRRGLSGRINDGKSAGGNAYAYVNALDEHGAKLIGEMAIHEMEAAVVRRIFREYASGRSPLKIAAGLNADRIPAPGAGNKRQPSGHWKQNTINGNRERGTGILNNELYIGRRIWNRLRYSKDPHTNRRVSRLNDRSKWEVAEVAHLRIVDQDLWDAVKTRQAALAKTRAKRKATDRNGLSASQGLRRRKFLLSGLLECGQCRGNMTIAGSG